MIKFKRIMQRLMVFSIGVPGVAALIFFLPHYNFLALNVIVVIFSSLGAIEFAKMLKTKGFSVYLVEAAILGSLAPISAVFIVSFGANIQIAQSFFVLGASWILISEIFFHKSTTDFSRVLNRLAAGFSVMIYPGLFLSWIITISTLVHSNIVLLAFAFTVIANDSMAWLTGMIFGKNNKGVFSVSPNKSIAGYIGGMSASIGVCIIFAYLFPEAFTPDQIAKFPSAIILGFFSGITVILGDLAESAIKRSCGFEDSGNLIPGRGGALDSTDSIALTAPLFYVLYRLLF